MSGSPLQRLAADVASGSRWWQRPAGTTVWAWRIATGSAVLVSVVAVLVSVWGWREVAARGLWAEVPVAVVAMVGAAVMPQPILRDRGRHVGVLLAALMVGMLSFTVHYTVLAAGLVALTAAYVWRMRWLWQRTLNHAITNIVAYTAWILGTTTVVVMLPVVEVSGVKPGHARLPAEWAVWVAVAAVTAGVAHLVFHFRWRWLVTIPLTVGLSLVLPLPDAAALAASPYPVGAQIVAMYAGMTSATMVYIWGLKAFGLDPPSDRPGRAWRMLVDGTVLVTVLIIPAWLIRAVLIASVPVPVVTALVTLTFWVTAVAFLVLLRAAQHRHAFTTYGRFLAESHDREYGDPLQALHAVVDSACEHLATGCDVTHAIVVLHPTQYRAGQTYAIDRMVPYQSVTTEQLTASDVVAHQVQQFRDHPAVQSVALHAVDGRVIGELLVASSGLPTSLQIRGGVAGLASLLAAELAAVDRDYAHTIPATWQRVAPFLAENLMTETLLRQIAAEWSHDTDTGHGVCIAHVRVHPPTGVGDHAAEIISTAVASGLLETVGHRPTLMARDDDYGFLVMIPQRFPGDGQHRINDAHRHLMALLRDHTPLSEEEVQRLVSVASTVTARLTPHTADTAIDTVKQESAAGGDALPTATGGVTGALA